MKNTYDIIIAGLVKGGGYATKEAEELIAAFIEEQRALDELRDSLHNLISE